MRSAGHEWFRGDLVTGSSTEPTMTSSGDRAFVRRLRELAVDWEFIGLSPRRSASAPGALPMVGVELPHLGPELGWLWILFLDVPEGRSLDCVWGDLTYLDDTGPVDGNSRMSGHESEATAEDMAARAAEWVVAQARRAVVLETWHGARGARRWSFSDNGAVLGVEGRSWPLRRVPRRAPDEVELLRLPH
jgi:hypothetical protein